MGVKPHIGVNNNFDRCPICKGNPKSCNHSLGDMIERVWEDWIRKIAREEIEKSCKS